MSEKKSKRKAEDEGVEANFSKKKPNSKAQEEEDEDEDELDDEDLELLQDSDLDEEGEGDEGDEEDDEEDEESDNDQFINNEIQVDFSAYETDESDFHGIKCLLQRLWLKENVDLSGLADLIIEENTIAYVLKQENEDESEKEEDNKEENGGAEGDQDDVYGIVSLILFNDHFTAKECVQQIKNLLLSRIPADNAIHQKLSDLKSTCALVVNERFINLPPKVSLPFYQALIDDIKQYKSGKDKPSYKFDHVIMVSKIQKVKKTKEVNKYGDTIYVNPEDEIFDGIANASFEYSVADQCDPDLVRNWDNEDKEEEEEEEEGGMRLEPFRKVLLLSRAKWYQAIETLKVAITEG